MPEVSVLMPSYNVGRYIDEAIDSILNQTFRDLELIIIDDCSVDNTVEVVEIREKCDNRIVFLRNEKNLGIAKTLNKGLSVAKGKYIVRMDSDDISLPNRIDILLSQIKQKQLDILGSSTITINEEGKHIGSFQAIEHHDDLVKTVRFSTPLLHIWICKKSLYDDVGEYRFPPVEDYNFLLRCISKGYKLGNVADKLYKVRLRSGNTADLYGYKQLKAFEAAYKSYRDGTNLPIIEKECLFNNFQSRLYSKSYYFLTKGSANLKSRKGIIALFYFTLSAFTSPYQFRYLYRRLRLSIYKKINL